MSWVDDTITKLEGAANGLLEVEIGGQKIVAKIGEEVILFFKQNKALLQRIGKDTFRSFLLLIHERRDEEAFGLVLAKMEADDIIARMKMNVADLNEHSDLKDEFYRKLKKFVGQALLKITTSVLIGLLLS